MTGYTWLKLAEALIEVHPEHGTQLLAILIDHAEHRTGLLNRFDSDCAELTESILEAMPEESWAVIEARLSSADPGERFQTLRWLSGGDLIQDGGGFWQAVPLEKLWAWVDQDVAERAWMVASVAPKSLDPSGSGLITRSLLQKYGDRDDVRRNLLGRFHSGSWWGNASDHFATQKAVAETWRERETEPRIRAWLTLYIQALSDEIERSRVYEERRGIQ